MSSFNAATLIENRLRANWTTTPIYLWESTVGGIVAKAREAYIVLEFMTGIAENVNINPPDYWWQEEAGFMIHAFDRLDRQNLTTVRQYLYQISNFYRNVTEGVNGSYDIEYRAAHPPQNMREPSEGGNWMGLSMFVPYRFRERHTLAA